MPKRGLAGPSPSAHGLPRAPPDRPAAWTVDSPVVPADALPHLPPRPAADAPKGDWRTWARAARHLIADPERSRRVSDAIRAWPPYARAGSVLLYLAFGSEVDLGTLEGDGAERILVPRNGDGPHGGLSLHRLRGAVLEKHPFGPRQPVAGTGTVAPSEVALALVPGLCFDVSGTRLGYGRGYFDRFLGALGPEVPRVGVTFEALVVDALPREPHDVLMTHLATEAGVRPVATAG